MISRQAAIEVYRVVAGNINSIAYEGVGVDCIWQAAVIVPLMLQLNASSMINEADFYLGRWEGASLFYLAR